MVEIQDNKRERQLISLFELIKDTGRTGVDAKLKIKKQIVGFELKSTTVGKVSTASSLTLNVIKRYRTLHWLIGIYNKKAELKCCYYGTPDNMKNWLDFWENDIKRGLKISNMLVDRIDKEMVYEIFGKKKIYSVDEAKFVYKKLFNFTEYDNKIDIENGYSIDRMLEMFKEHNKFYLYRGSAINNPKIPKEYYEKWEKIDCDYPETLRKLVSTYINK